MKLAASISSLVVIIATTETTLRPVYAQEPPLDVIFLVDESISMDPIQSEVRNNIPLIFRELSRQTMGNFRAGIVGFGAYQDGGEPLIRQTLTSDQNTFANAAAGLTDDGSSEYGLLAIIETHANNVNGEQLGFDFPSTRGFCAVVLTDEESEQNSNKATERYAAAQALQGSALFAVINEGAGESDLDYGTLAHKVYGISTFDGTVATTIIQDIIDVCVTTIGQGDCRNLQLEVAPDAQVTSPTAADLYQGDPVSSLAFTVGMELPNSLGVGTFNYGLTYTFAADGSTDMCRGTVTVTTTRRDTVCTATEVNDEIQPGFPIQLRFKLPVGDRVGSTVTFSAGDAERGRDNICYSVVWSDQVFVCGIGGTWSKASGDLTTSEGPCVSPGQSMPGNVYTGLVVVLNP